MFDFGDELTVEGYRIPWLIWIQILVLFLLLILLFCFSFFPSDLSDTSTSSSSASPSTVDVFMPLNPYSDKQILKHRVDHRTTVTNRFQHSQARQNQSIKGEISTSTVRRIVGEDNLENPSNCIRFHPCYYFRLAKLALLKCFGLDSASDGSSNSDQKKER